MNGLYRRSAGSVALWLGLMSGVRQAQAQFGATGVSDLPWWLVWGPWVVLAIALPGAWWWRRAWRPRLCTAMRRAVIAYLFIEFVPVLTCMLVIAVFDVGRTAGMMLWAMSMLGVIFSGLVLLTFVSLALALDGLVACRRKPRTGSPPRELGA